MRDVLSQHDRLSKTIDAIDRLTGAIEKLHGLIEGLGRVEDSRYTTAKNVSNDMVDGRTMASLIGITQRTLGEHRRRGRLPGAWQWWMCAGAWVAQHAWAARRARTYPSSEKPRKLYATMRPGSLALPEQRILPLAERICPPSLNPGVKPSLRSRAGGGRPKHL